MSWMKTINTSLLAVTVAFAGAATGAAAADLSRHRGVAEDYGHRHRAHHPRPSVTTAHGCYFFRGRRHCSRYCYWEMNGHRYCQRHPRDAYPQAGFVIEEVYPRRWRW